MNIKNNKRKRESIKRMEDAFVRLIQTKEIKDISVTEICKTAGLNRSTFYANYIDIYDLVDKMRERMAEDFRELYEDEVRNRYNTNDYLKLFYHIRENQLFYKTYFKMQFDLHFQTGCYDTRLAQTYYNNQHIKYHSEFFRAGITAIIKIWLEDSCDLSPEELFDVIKSEYAGKSG